MKSHSNKGKKFNFIHFNDVYDIQGFDKEPVGGAARFVAEIARLKEEYDDPLVLFSGDAFSPSMLSTMFEGEQTLKPLNAMQIDLACYGNHEFDFSLPRINELTQQCDFTWLLSNIFNKQTNSQLVEGSLDHTVLEKNGLKIGFMGIAEADWLCLISEIDAELLGYEDFVQSAKRLSKQLKEQEKCDLVVALTHMRLPNDKILCKEVPDIDLVLGGHDHMEFQGEVNQSFLLKSGSDFKNLSINTFEILEPGHGLKTDLENKVFIIKNKYKIVSKIIDITSDMRQDPEIQEHVEYYLKKCNDEMQKTIGFTDCDIETRFNVIRSEEANWTNFYADIMRVELNADCALVNGGTVRSDCIFEKGKLIFQDVNKMLPFKDAIVVKEVRGDILHQALENGVSKHPTYEGRFPAVSNMTVKFDPEKPAGQRIKKEHITVKGEVLDYNKNYAVALKYFIANGKDGYDMFKNCPDIISVQLGLDTTECLTNFFFSYRRSKQRSGKSQSKNLAEGDNELLDDDLLQLHKTNSYVPNKTKTSGHMFSHKYQSALNLSCVRQHTGIVPLGGGKYNTSKFEVYKLLGIVKGIRQENGEDFIVINPQVEGRVKICKHD